MIRAWDSQMGGISLLCTPHGIIFEDLFDLVLHGTRQTLMSL